LYFYVKNNLSEIIKECEMSDIIGAATIVMDIATHLNNSELDLVMKFESFRSKIM
jgi:hypothetical protein